MVSSSSRDLDVESRLHRREVVADLAREALEAGDLHRVLEGVVAATTETLGCRYCGAFESLPGGEQVGRRAGGGAPAGPEGANVPAGDGTLAGAVLDRAEPLVVDDLSADERVPDAEAGLVPRGESAVAVRVGPAADPWGLLVAGATDPGAFTGSDGEFLRRVGEVVASAAEREAAGREPVDAELEEIYGRISDAFFALDEEWRFTYLNDRAHDLINPEDRTLVGENVWELFPEAVGRKFKEQYERAMYEQETVSSEEYYPEPLDAWFEVRAYPSETGLSVYFRDVTDRKRTRQQLAEERDMFAEGPAVVFRWRNEEGWPVEYVSENVEDVLGYAPAELESGDVPYTDLLLESELDRVAGEVEANSDEATERFSHEPYRVRTKDGDVRWVKDTTKIIRDERGQITHYLGYLVDITERKERERELERFETLFEESTDVNAVMNPDGTYQYLPPSVENVLGYEAAELEGEVAFDYIHPEDRERIVEEFGRLAAEPGYEPTEEFRYKHADGSWIWIEATGRNLLEEPHIDGIVAYTRDVTERREYERRLEESERRYRTLAEHFPNGAVGVYDEDLRYTLAEGTKLGGVLPTAEELEGARMPELFPEHTVADLEPIFRAAVEDGEIGNRRTRFGGRYWRVWAAPLRDGDGEIFAGLSFAQDVTEQVERERRLERFETIVETVDDGVYVVDEDGYFTMVNEAYAEMLGYPQEDLVGMHASTIADNDVLEEVAAMQERMESGDIDEPSMEAEVLTASGEPLPAEATFALLPEDDERWHRVGVVRDISERKERERRLAESERRYRTLVENFPDGAVAMFDEEMEYTVAGGQLLEDVGVDRSERVGNSVYEIYPDDLVAEIEPYFEAVFDGESNAFEVEFYDRQLFANTLPVRNVAGEIFAGMLVVQDVTERKEYERELETRARQQQAVAELGQYALEVDDLDEFMAEAARRVAGVLGSEYCAVLELDDEDRQLLLRQGVGWDDGVVGGAAVDADADDSQAGATLESDAPVVVEDLAADDRFDGPALLADHDVDSGVSTVIGSIDDPWGILGTHDTAPREFTDEDVNFVQSVANILAEAIERHQYQAELEGLVADLEESNERLEQFAYAASHDLQEPLRMVSSYLQLVEKRYAEELDADGEDFIEFAVDGAERMREMIDALLAYSRVETRGDPFEPVDLEAVLADVREDLQVKIEERDAEITTGSLPTVEGDRDQLRQVFQNLLDNAIEYSGDAPPRIHVDAERGGGRVLPDRVGGLADRGDECVVSVADEGIGIPSENTDRVFEVFQRLHSREDHEGTGIGLALCERIVERHGGEIWVDSEPGEGATFRFTLPAGGPDE